MARVKVNIAKLIITAFYALVRQVFKGDGGRWWMRGGRGSTKSSFISLCIVLLVVKFPFANAVIVRRYSNTLRDSVYQQIIWAIAELGLTEWFKTSISPMEITYKPTGQRIVFRGLDDPLKLKSTKFTIGYCAIAWFEEIDQMRCWEDVSSALKSFKRGGDVFWEFYSYNPPRDPLSWVNEKAEEMEANPACVVNYSTYLDVIEAGHADWLGRPFLEDAEYLRITNPTVYAWEMLGEVTGLEGAVFPNIEDMAFDDADINNMKWARCGIDWGFANDPWVILQVGYDRARKEVYIYGEEHGTLLSDEEAVRRSKRLLARGGKFDRTAQESIAYADSEDPKSIASWKQLGWNIRGAKKWRNSVEAGVRWLQTRSRIYIDRSRCPLAWKEFTRYSYERDKDGNVTGGLPDKDNHTIDACRYALSKIISSKKEV